MPSKKLSPEYVTFEFKGAKTSMYNLLQNYFKPEYKTFIMCTKR